MTNHTPDMPREELTDYRLEQIENAVKTMAESVQSLVALEQKHAETREALGRAFKQNESLEARVRALELAQASSTTTSRGMSSAINIIATAFVTAAAALWLPHLIK
ncbi:hypothetical protein [Burkholderia sp. Bp8990]|uniref:hypothetical protein n=1 Tax=Burkholderia sp. Bp8990 TaxID=2184552 RepID=UPI000F5980B7|nr:hypothetical protein [Burkholderia sp. Bp8990]RQS39765.1 hypothetical protein DIE01_16260 [Burkholderia sp. Bp8990]